MKEIKDVLEDGGTNVGYRHLSLLCDMMTRLGCIMSVTRHGIKKTKTGPLSKSTFEQSVDILTDAAVNNVTDPLSGTSDHIMMGKLISSGTGSFDVLLDSDKLLNFDEPMEDIEEDEYLDDIVNGAQNIGFWSNRFDQLMKENVVERWGD